MIKHPKYPRGNLYLSGGIEHAVDFGSSWRAEISPKLKQLGYFPLDIAALDKEYARRHGQLFHDFGVDEEGLLRRKANIRKHFIFTDLELIKNDSDALIVFYDESVRMGAGTISECQFAYMLDLPVFLVSDWINWKEEVPGWLHALTTKVFVNFDDLLEYLGCLPEGILKRDIYGNHHTGDYYLCSLSGEPFKKSKTHFVSKVSPLYSKESVKVVKTVNEDMKNRYEFCVEFLQEQAEYEMKNGTHKEEI